MCCCFFLAYCTCGMIVSLFLRSCRPIEEISTLSMRMRPPAASIIRNRQLVKLDFPAPVRPTMPIWMQRERSREANVWVPVLREQHLFLTEFQNTNLLSAFNVTGDSMEHQIQSRSVADLVVVKAQPSFLGPVLWRPIVCYPTRLQRQKTGMNKNKHTKPWNKSKQGHWKESDEVAEVKMGFLMVFALFFTASENHTSQIFLSV